MFPVNKGFRRYGHRRLSLSQEVLDLAYISAAFRTYSRYITERVAEAIVLASISFKGFDLQIKSIVGRYRFQLKDSAWTWSTFRKRLPCDLTTIHLYPYLEAPSIEICQSPRPWGDSERTCSSSLGAIGIGPNNTEQPMHVKPFCKSIGPDRKNPQSLNFLSLWYPWAW